MYLFTNVACFRCRFIPCLLSFIFGCPTAFSLSVSLPPHPHSWEMSCHPNHAKTLDRIPHGSLPALYFFYLQQYWSPECCKCICGHRVNDLKRIKIHKTGCILVASLLSLFPSTHTRKCHVFRIMLNLCTARPLHTWFSPGPLFL